MCMYEGTHESSMGNSLFSGCAMLVSLHNGKVKIQNKTLCEDYVNDVINWLNSKKNQMHVFKQNLESIKFAYNIGVFSKEYARNKFARLYAEIFGSNSSIYREMALGDFEECFYD